MFASRPSRVRGALFTVVALAATSIATPSAAQAEPPTALAAVVPPRLRSDARVPYPEGARGDATVVLVLVVTTDGTVKDATSDGAGPPFSDAAIAAARAWTYEPATRAGRPVAAKIKVLVAFTQPKPPEPEPPPPAEPSRPPSSASRSAARAPVIEQARVTGLRAEAGRTASLSRAEVRQVPGTFGDPFRAVEIMPGVTPIVSGLPYFFVRGAPPGNVGYFLDGLRVPVLFHVGAGPSVVNPGFVRQVDLYPGGYPARYGRFAGGVVAGELLDPLDRPHGEFNLRLFDVGAMAETPFASGRGSVAVGGRYSYTAGLFSLFSPDTILQYWDYQARATFALTEDDRIAVLALGSYDYLAQKVTPDAEPLTLFGAEFHRLDLRYERRLGRRGKLRQAVTLGVDSSGISAERSTRDRLVGTRTELEYRVSPTALLRAGADMQLDSYDVRTGLSDLSPSASSIASLFPSRADLVLGARADVVFVPHERLEVVPGARIDLFTSDGAVSGAIDPRIATRTRLTDRVSVLSAAGLAHQAPAFVVPVPGLQPGGLRGGLQKAVQQSLGVALDLLPDTTLTVTGFHNGFFDMSDPLGSTPRTQQGCPPGSMPADTLAGDRVTDPGQGGSNCGARFTPGTLGPDRSGGGGQGADSTNGQRTANALEVRTRGRSYGLEVFLKKRLTSRLGGFFSYTLSRSTRTYADRDYVATFDRAHVVNLAIALDLGRNWRAGSRVVFYTGVPKASGSDEAPTERLPPFFRLDVRLEKRWILGKTAHLAFVAEWLNATLTKESIASRCTLSGCESQFIGPVTIPSLGLEGGF